MSSFYQKFLRKRIKELQNTFDSNKIKYTENFYDPDMNGNVERTLPKWVNTMDLTKNQAGSSGDQPFLGKQNVSPQYPL